MTRPIALGLLALLSTNTALSFPVPSKPQPVFSNTQLAVSQQEEDEREPGPADLEEAIEIAVKRFGGEPAGAATVERNNRTVHEVRLLVDDSVVRTVWIDPNTGEVVPQGR